MLNTSKASQLQLPKCLKHYLTELSIKPSKPKTILQLNSKTQLKNQKTITKLSSFGAVDVGEKISRTTFRNKQEINGIQNGSPKVVKSL